MKKTAKTIAVSITRLGSDPVAVTLPVGSTVADALDQAGIEVPETAEFFVGGIAAESHDELEDKDNVSMVTPKQAGI